jgi:ABC-type multidrug transport system permease subunit
VTNVPSTTIRTPIKTTQNLPTTQIYTSSTVNVLANTGFSISALTDMLKAKSVAGIPYKIFFGFLLFICLLLLLCFAFCLFKLVKYLWLKSKNRVIAPNLLPFSFPSAPIPAGYSISYSLCSKSGEVTGNLSKSFTF